MQIRVLFFGMLKEIAGAEHTLEMPAGAALREVFEYYAARHAPLRAMSASIVLARNREFAGGETPLGDGDEIAFLPPVSGGAGLYAHEIRNNGNLFAVTRNPIDVRKLIDEQLRGADGAVVTFEGVGRNNTAGRLTRWLEYEGYESMAVEVMARIGGEIAAGRAIGHIAMVHRLGRILIGETSVAIVATAAHRKPALEAVGEAIDRLKRLVPIWKKEFFADGSSWMEGEWDRHVPRMG